MTNQDELFIVQVARSVWSAMSATDRSRLLLEPADAVEAEIPARYHR